MQLVLGPGSAALHIWLDLPAADALQLHLTAASVAQSLTAAPKIKLADKHVKCVPMMSTKSEKSISCCCNSCRAGGQLDAPLSVTVSIATAAAWRHRRSQTEADPLLCPDTP